MDERLTEALPQDSEAQRIGRAAEQSFFANRPIAWKVDALSGSNDCGYDFQIQVVKNACVTHIFRVQLKGETSPTLNTAKTHYSVVLDVSTVNYYALAIEPILLIFCDLTSAQKPKDCNLYYCWIHEELQRIRSKGVAPSQRTVTFHVPVQNNLSDDLDLSNDINSFKKSKRLGEGLDHLLQQSGLDAQQRTSAMTRLLPNLERRSATLIGALVDDGATSWIEAPENSLQWLFQEADTALRSGHRRRCHDLLNHAEALLGPAKQSEHADYWHLKGRLANFDEDVANANTAFEKAFQLNPSNEKHLTFWAETELCLRLSLTSGHPDFSHIIRRLTSNSADVQAMKARILAADGNFEEAHKIASSIGGIEGKTARAIIFSMQSKWQEAIDNCNEAIAETDSRKLHPKLLLLTHRARARFSIAVGIDQSGSDEIALPANGPANVSIPILLSAWEDISEAVDLLRSHGWPPHVVGVADIWANTAIILGLQESVLPVMKEAGEVRPRMPQLQEGVELLAVRSNNFELALKANGRQPETDRSIQRRITLLNMAGKHSECIALMEAKGEHSASNPYTYGHAMSLAIFSAEKMIRKDLVERWTNLLNTNQAAAPVAALHRYFSAISSSTLGKGVALAELEAEYERLGRPAFIAKTLLYELDATRPIEATKIIELAEELKRGQLPSADESLILAQALTTLQKWPELLELSNHSIVRFKQHDRLVAVGAMALDRLGRTTEARDRLQDLIAKDRPDSLALNTYLNIAIVSGLTVEAIRCLENVLSNETGRRSKLHCLRHMFALIQTSDPTSPRLLDIAWKIGELADQKNESEEGLFLISVLSLVTNANAPIALTDDQKAELARRTDTFTEKFPNSEILRRRLLPDNISGKDLLKMLEEFTGVGEKQIREREKLRNLISRGSTAAPFAWRPSFILGHVPDVVTLWEIAKTSNWDHREFHLTMALADWRATPYPLMQSRVPLLDLTALLVVHDLDLFDTLFQIFPKIAVGKATLIQLQNLKSNFSVSTHREKCRNIFSALQTRLTQIEQPSANPPEDNGFLKAKWASQEIVAIARADTRFFVYSDDVLFRIYATEGNSSTLSICTLDMLAAAESRNILKPQIVAAHIAQLCEWRVGVAVGPRHLIAALPDELASVKSIDKAVEIIGTGPSGALFNGIWDWRKPFTELGSHIGSLLRELIDEPRNPIIILAAVVGLWASKARLHLDAPSSYSELIGIAVVQAVIVDHALTETSAQSLWKLYHCLIEAHYGDRMDDCKYVDSIQALAHIAALADVTLGLNDRSSAINRLRSGMTMGTSDYDRFNRSVDRSLTKLARNTPKP